MIDSAITMDELIGEFIEETNEALDLIDQKIIEFERNPQNQDIIDHVFRAMHTIKGTCGFLNMPRLEKIAHAGESLISKFREGKKPSRDAVNLILKTIDKIKKIILQIEKDGKEGPKQDDDQILIQELNDICNKINKTKTGKPQQKNQNLPEQIQNQIQNQVIVDQKQIEQNFQNSEQNQSLDNKNTNPKNINPKNTNLKNTNPKNINPKNTKPSENNSKIQKTIKVNVNTIENLMNTIRELVLTRNQLQNILRRKNDQEGDNEFRAPIQNLSGITAELQENVMKTRMQPIGNAWQKLPRIVRELSGELQKQIEIKMFGDETELDRQILELIKDPLTHMVRNCIDHAIEKPEVRKKINKNPQGLITLNAKHQAGYVVIQLKDDGGGINLDKVKDKVIKNNIATKEKLDTMSDKQIYQYIFHPGFSTAEKITNVSGRGVGMDVVRKNIEIIGGSIEIKSEKNKGTEFNINIPLTLAIVSSFIVVVGEEKFAIPQISVVELVRVAKTNDTKIEVINNLSLLRLRKKLLPLVYLDQILKINPNNKKQRNQFVVVVKDGDRKIGLVVDGIDNNEEIVVKPVSTLLRAIKIYSGITILGDGSVVMILEPNAIIEQFFQHNDAQQNGKYEIEQQQKNENDNLSKMLLFYKNGDTHSAQMAIPLEVVTRIEKINAHNFYDCGGELVVKYRDKLMKISFLEQRFKEIIQKNTCVNVLVFTKNQKYSGLVIGDIIDIVEEDVSLYPEEKKEGIFCTTIINQKVTTVIDIEKYIFNTEQKITKDDEQQVSINNNRLILVDDSFFFRNMIDSVLRAAGYEVTTCKSAAEAIDIIKNNDRFDIVVTDIEMPDINGFQFVKMLREIPQYKNIPVIALSGVYSKEELKKSNAKGFQEHIAKFDRRGLIDTLKRFSSTEKAA